MTMNADSVTSFAIPVWRMMYATIDWDKFNKKSVFSQHSLLHTLSDSETSARTLVRHIFMNQNLIEKKRSSDECAAKLQKSSSNARNAQDRRFFYKAQAKSSRFLQTFGPAVLRESKRSEKVPELKPPSDFVKAFGPALSKKGLGKKRSRLSSRKNHVPRHLRKAIAVCHTVLKKSKKNKYRYLLKVHCEVPDKKIRRINFESVVANQNLKNDVMELLKLHSPVHQVFLFLRAVIRYCFPWDIIWGIEENERAFMKNMEKFLYCRRYDVITLKDFLLGISVSNISWLAGPNAKNSFCKFLKWMLLDFIFVILKRFFYITEHTSHRYRLVYFRKDIWEQLVIRASKLMVNNGLWSSADSSTPAQYAIKFYPKKSGLRPIMKRIANERNSALLPFRDILVILRHICGKFPRLRGCSSSGSNDISCRWRDFWKACRKKHSCDSTAAVLYFVKVDVDQCFDTIPVDLLLCIIREILDRSAHVEINSLFSFKRKYTKVAHCADAVYNTLAQSLKNVHVSVMGKKFIKSKGIPQGWCLSSLLCDILYANLEDKYLQDFSSNHKTCNDRGDDCVKMLIRFVDDFMFVSTSKSDAVAFIRKMQSGFPEYGFKINWRKTCVNFSVSDIGLENMNEISVLNGEPFPWFGMLFPTLVPYKSPSKRFCSGFHESSNYGGVSIDLSRYSSASSIRDSTSILPSFPEYRVFKSLSRSLRLRVATIYFDLNVNSHTRVLRNMYELGMLVACKWLVHNMCKPQPARTSCSNATILVIRRLAIVALVTIRKKLPKQKFPSVDIALWIFYKAFRKKLIRYQNAYKKIGALLTISMRRQEEKLKKHSNWNCIRSYLRSATALFPQHLSTIRIR